MYAAVFDSTGDAELRQQPVKGIGASVTPNFRLIGAATVPQRERKYGSHVYQSSPR